MLLDSQIQFADQYLKPLSRDEKVQLPAGYKEKFEKWLRESGVKTYQKTPEELAKMFAYFLEKDLKVDTIDAIDKLKAPKEEKAKLRALAARGQVLLASRDGGKTFDRLLTLEDLKAVKLSDYVLLTPTMRSTSRDLAETIHEQTIFHVISKFAQSGILAEYERMEGDDIVISVSHPKFGQDVIRVNTAGDISQPLVFRSEKTGREFSESQMPEVYGVTQLDPSLQPLSKEEVVALHLTGQGIDPTQHIGAFAATAAIAKTADLVNRANQAAMFNAFNQAQMQKLLGDQKAKGFGLAQVMAAKARMLRQRGEAEEREKLFQARKEKYAQAERELAREEQAKEEQAKEQKKQNQKQRTQKMAVAGAAVGGAAISGGSLFMFLNNINLNF